MSDTSRNDRRRHQGAIVALAVALLLAPVSAHAGSGKKAGSTRAREAAQGKGSSKMNVLVRFQKAPGAVEKALVKGLGGQERRKLKASSRWLSLRIPAHRIATLADSTVVDHVSLDEPVMTESMDIAREAANEPTVFAPESAFKGAGVTIAVVDTGVALHPDIQNLTAVVDVVANPIAHAAAPEESIDPNGHGTHVAGIMVGTGSRSGGRLAGVAPEASLVSVRVLDDIGRGLTSDLLAGLQWIGDHKDEYGIRVVNISLGHPVFEPASVDPLVEAVDALWDAGLVIVCSAGNRGREGHFTVTSPCNSAKVITVGATNFNHSASIHDDRIATYSSRGPTAFDLFAKPDLVAPGNRIVSLRSPGSHSDTLLPDRRMGDPAHPEALDYFEMSGTSMASPIVAATAALMLQQDPSLNPGTVKARLMMSARKAKFGDPLVSGAGYLDILGALTATGTVADAPSPRAVVNVEEGWIEFENTAVTWGNDVFSLRALWAEAVAWSDPDAYLQPSLRTNGEMWPPGTNGAQAELWPESELWPEAEMWPDCTPWTPALTAPEETGPVLTEALSSGFRDP